MAAKLLLVCYTIRVLEEYGYRLVAYTPHKDGVSYDAMPIQYKGRRKLVHSEIKATPEEAMVDLLKKVQNAGS